MHVLLIKSINYQGTEYINKVNEVFSYLTYEKEPWKKWKP